MTLPYAPGLTEPLRRIFSEYDIRVSVKPTVKLRQLLVRPKDKAKAGDQAGVVYNIECEGRLNNGEQCKETYIGETERTLHKRFLEHRRPSSVSSSEVARHVHIESPGHEISQSGVKILARESDYKARGIKEAIYIRMHRPSLNEYQGRYNLPPVWDGALQSGVNANQH